MVNTIRDGQEDREKIMGAGCNGYFEKPIDPLTIMGRIEEIVKGV